jgi:hypothetical protein
VNEVLKTKEQHAYSLKTYDNVKQLEETIKRRRNAANGKFAIEKDDITDTVAFVHRAIAFDKCLEGTIIRNKDCSKLGYIDYDFETNDGLYLLSCKKMPFHLGSNYNISLMKKNFKDNSEFFVGKVQGNFTGSVFNVYSALHSDQDAR